MTYRTQPVNATAARFPIEEVSADKGYIGQDNVADVVAVGAVPRVPFKSNTTGQAPELCRKLYYYFMFNRDEFHAHDHTPSAVEMAFSMITDTFGDSVPARMETAQVDELPCKVLCHNLSVLVHAIWGREVELVS